MLKIVADTGSGGRSMLRLEGQIVGPWVAELARACEPVLARREALALDLTAVSFVSREGVDLLSRLRDRRVELLSCSAFVAEQLRAQRVRR
jgi:hypothetical protein